MESSERPQDIRRIQVAFLVCGNRFRPQCVVITRDQCASTATLSGSTSKCQFRAIFESRAAFSLWRDRLEMENDAIQRSRQTRTAIVMGEQASIHPYADRRWHGTVVLRRRFEKPQLVSRIAQRRVGP